jgi:hypothetical protein
MILGFKGLNFQTFHLNHWFLESLPLSPHYLE